MKIQIMHGGKNNSGQRTVDYKGKKSAYVFPWSFSQGKYIRAFYDMIVIFYNFKLQSPGVICKDRGADRQIHP